MAVNLFKPKKNKPEAPAVKVGAGKLAPLLKISAMEPVGSNVGFFPSDIDAPDPTDPEAMKAYLVAQGFNPQMMAAGMHAKVLAKLNSTLTGPKFTSIEAVTEEPLQAEPSGKIYYPSDFSEPVLLYALFMLKQQYPDETALQQTWEEVELGAYDIFEGVSDLPPKYYKMIVENSEYQTLGADVAKFALAYAMKGVDVLFAHGKLSTLSPLEKMFKHGQNYGMGAEGIKKMMQAKSYAPPTVPWPEQPGASVASVASGTPGPTLQQIQEQYAHDPEALLEAMAQYLKTHQG